MTVLIQGIAAGLFGLTAALYLCVFKKNRLRVITGIILAVYAAYIVKDIVYLLPYVAADSYIYRVLLSVDNWAVPLYVVYAFEVISPGRITALRLLFLFFPFVGMTILYAIWPYEWMFSLQILFTLVFSAACMCVVLRMTVKYRRRLLDNCSNITHMDIRWMWVSIALFLPNLVLWTFLSVRLDYVLDAVYYISLSVSWGIVAYNTYYFVPQAGQDHWADPLPSQPELSSTVVSYNFARKLSELASNGYFIRSPRLTLSELAAELGTNRTTLSNYLNQEVGTTFYDYINSHRVSEAERLLAEPSGHWSVEQLAEMSGFNSVSTFRRAFSKKHGLSPQQYRERMLRRR